MDKDERLEVIRVLSTIAESQVVSDAVDDKELEKIRNTLDVCKDIIRKIEIENDRDSIDEKMYDISYDQVLSVVSKIAIDIIEKLINSYHTVFTPAKSCYNVQRYVDFLDALVSEIRLNRQY